MSKKFNPFYIKTEKRLFSTRSYLYIGHENLGQCPSGSEDHLCGIINTAFNLGIEYALENKLQDKYYA